MVGDAPNDSMPGQSDRKSLIWPVLMSQHSRLLNQNDGSLGGFSEAGLTGQSKPVWDLHIVPDLAPQIALNKPLQDLVVTPEATHRIWKRQQPMTMELLSSNCIGESGSRPTRALNRKRRRCQSPHNRSGLEPSPQSEPPRTWRASWNWTPSEDAMLKPGGLIIPGHSLQFLARRTRSSGQMAESDRRSLRLRDPSAVVDDAIAEQRNLLQKLERNR